MTFDKIDILFLYFSQILARIFNIHHDMFWISNMIFLKNNWNKSLILGKKIG